MSIFFSRRADTVRITPCSRRARSTGRRCHHMPPTDPWRVRGVGMDPCPKHAQPLRRARARAAGRSLASASPQRMAAGPADRISDLHAQHHAALKGTARSSAPVCNAPASSRRCRPPLSSRKPGQVPRVAKLLWMATPEVRLWFGNLTSLNIFVSREAAVLPSPLCRETELHAIEVVVL